MFENIPRNRLLMYGLALGAVPFLTSFLFFLSSMSSIDLVKARLDLAKDNAFIFEKKQANNRAVINHFEKADHFYIDKNLEPIVFLEAEIESLEKLSSNKNYAFDDTIKKRLDFLNNQNQLILTEGAVQKNLLFQETIETLNHPIEVDTKDILNILSRIEGVKITDFLPPDNPPQFIILNFKIERKNTSEKNENYLLNLKILKREFL